MKHYNGKGQLNRPVWPAPIKQRKKREKIGDNMGGVGSKRQCSLSGGLTLPQVSALAGQQIPFDNILFAMPHFVFSCWKCLCWICFLLTSWASLSLLFPPCVCQQGSHIRCASTRATVIFDGFSRPDNQNQNYPRLLKLLTLFVHASAFIYIAPPKTNWWVDDKWK